MQCIQNSLGKEGLIFLPTGEDLWFTGHVICSRLEFHCDPIEWSFGNQKTYLASRAEIDITATCVGVPDMQIGKPELVQELSVNELLRRINRRLKER